MRHFKTMLMGIIEYDGRHTISKLNSSQLDTRDVSNDIKFIRDTDWTCEELLKLNRDYLKNTAKKSKAGFLIIDDTVIEKQGKPKKIEGLGWHYSHSKGRTVYGHCMVSSHYRIGDISFPDDFRFYLNEDIADRCGNEFKSKPDIACELIEKFESFTGEKVYCLTDSWYTSEKL